MAIDATVHGHLRSLYEHSMDAMLLGHPDGRVVMASPAACALFGLTEAEIIAGGRAGLLDMGDPAVMQAIQEYPGRGRFRAEVQAVHASGERIPIELSAVDFAGDDGETYTSVVIRDLRPRVAAEQARFLSEQRFGRLVGAMSQLVWNASPDGNRIDAPGWETLTGQALAEAQQGGWLEMVHPRDRGEVAVAWQRTVSDAVPYNVEFRLRTPTGDYRWVRARAVGIRDVGGELSEWLGFLEDTDAVRRTREALVERERTFRAIFEISAQGIIVQDAEGRFVEVNAAASEILGIPHAQLIGRAANDLDWDIVRADGTFYPPEERPSVRALRTGQPMENELLGMWNPVRGEYRWLLMHARPLFRTGEAKPYKVCVGFSDLTELRAANEQAVVSAERTRRILETVTDAITIADAEGVLTYANAAAERVLGLAASAVPGRTYGDPRWRITAVAGGEFPHDELPFRRVKRTGQPVYDVQHAIEHADGRRVILSVNAAPLWNRKGEFAGIVAAIRDVTEAQREQTRLAHLAAVVASSPDAMIGADRDGRITAWNGAAEQIFGYSAESILGQPARLLIPPEMLGEYRELLAALEQGASRSGIETWQVRKDGTVFPASISIAPMRAPDGRIMGATAVVRDMSQRREAEDRLRFQASLLDNVQEAVAAIDAEGCYVYLNRRSEELMGWPPEHILGRHYAEIVSRAFPAEVVQLIERTLAGESWVGELSVRDSHGNELPALLTLAPIHDDTGAISGAVGLISDLRQVRALEEQLGQAQKMEAIGRLAGGVAHDFNNVLTAIQGNAQLALDVVPEHSEVAEDLQEILRSAERATTLTRHLLAFSRRQVLQPRVVEVADVIHGLDRMLRRLIGEDIEFSNDCPPQVASVLVDPVQLEQVVLNLVMNARDAMPDGGRLAMRTRALPGTGTGAAGPAARDPHVLISVVDTGTGIAPDIQRRIFEPFFTTKAAGKGSGLGLSTAYGIVQQSGGFITVKSTEGQGAEFNVYLPIAAAAIQPAPPPVATGHDRRGTETVLLVEDEVAVRRLAHRTLAARGYRVIEAEDGLAALAIAAAHPGDIDILVTDIVMPRMNGLQLVAQLRAARPGIAAVLMSGYSEEVVEQRGAIPHDSIFLSKPFRAEALAAAVRDALNVRAG